MFMDAPAANAPDFDPKLTGDRLEATLDGTVSRVTREYIKLSAGRRTGASMAHCSRHCGGEPRRCGSRKAQPKQRFDVSLPILSIFSRGVGTALDLGASLINKSIH
jgi:hypothetical protein